MSNSENVQEAINELNGLVIKIEQRQREWKHEKYLLQKDLKHRARDILEKIENRDDKREVGRYVYYHLLNFPARTLASLLETSSNGIARLVGESDVQVSSCGTCGTPLYAESREDIKNRGRYKNSCDPCHEKRKTEYKAKEKERELRQQEEEKKRNENLTKIVQGRPTVEYLEPLTNAVLKDLGITPEKLQVTDEKIQQLKSMKYSKYLKTNHWKILKELVLERDRKCWVCGRENHLLPHHLRYDHKGELLLELNDCIGLCRHHHKIVHERLGTIKL